MNKYDGNYNNPDEAAYFIAVFGEGRAAPPDMVSANHGILDFCSLQPDGKASTGKARGRMAWS